MKISLGQLDLEALKNYLKIVQGFRTVNDPSGDTEHVDGIPSNFIAKITTVEDPEVQELLGRNTVDNAMNLVRIKEDNTLEIISSENILTEQEGQKLQDTAIAASKNTSDDMRSLRNEMYHLKRDMIRTGSMAYDPVYDGFIDPFLNGLELCSRDPLTVESTEIDSANISEGDISGYDVNQYAVLMAQGQLSSIERITNKLGLNLEFQNKISNINEIQKTFGLYDKGKFVFASDGSGMISNLAQMNMIYKDGPDRVKVAELNQENGVVGFASTIVVPAELDENYLREISLSLRKIGNPGSCYLELYDYNVNNLYGDPVAVSNYLSAGKASDVWTTYKFTFDNEQLLEKGHIYLLLIKSSSTNRQNMWYVGGFAEQCNNSIHQDTFLYTTDSKFQKEGPDLVTNQVYDMFMGLYTTETKQLALNYSQRGIYTGSFELEHNEASRVRVSFNPRLSNQYYKVVVKGKTKSEELVNGMQITDAKVFNHITWANGEQSAPEYVYDFAFDKAVNFVEFQIVFDNPNPVGEQNHEALFAVVVSTDNAYIKEADK